MDESFWQQVERAKQMTGEQRLIESLQLFDRSRSLMLAGIRSQFPDAPPEEVQRKLLERLAISRRIQSTS